jgi:hypothetical protein
MGILIILLWLTLFVLGPFISITAINTLFGTQIEFTFYTWLCVVWLASILSGSGPRYQKEVKVRFGRKK